MTSTQIAYWQLQEQMRNNRAVEAETARSNQARESLTDRYNRAHFGLESAKLKKNIVDSKFNVMNWMLNSIGMGSESRSNMTSLVSRVL